MTAPLRLEVSANTGVALIVIGMVIGAGVALTVTYAEGGLGARTSIITRTFTSVSIVTMFTTSQVLYAQITSTAIACKWNGSQEYCQVTISNSGNLGTATTGLCTLTYGGHAYAGYTGPTLATAVSPGLPQQLIPGGSVGVYCRGSGGEAAGAGVQILGTFPLANGGQTIFSVNATS